MTMPWTEHSIYCRGSCLCSYHEQLSPILYVPLLHLFVVGCFPHQSCCAGVRKSQAEVAACELQSRVEHAEQLRKAFEQQVSLRKEMFEMEEHRRKQSERKAPAARELKFRLWSGDSKFHAFGFWGSQRQ